MSATESIILAWGTSFPDSPCGSYPDSDDAQNNGPNTLLEATQDQTLRERLFPDNLPRELAHNGLRDPTWTVVSALNLAPNLQAIDPLDTTKPLQDQIASNSFLQPVAAQWICGTAPMLILAAGETVVRKAKGEELTASDLGKIWAPVAAASAAIPMWDLGQTIGSQIGTSQVPDSSLWYGSSIAGGLIAAPFTGMFEGFTQWGVKYAIDLATNPVKQEMWNQDPAFMGKLLAKEVVLNTTIGAIPGAVWQLVYFFLLPVLIVALGPVGGIIVAAILVGLAVMTCNFVCTHAINRASAAIDGLFGWNEIFKELEKKAQRAVDERLLTPL